VENLINFCGFFGAWLLVAGPLAQGAKELSEEMIEREHLTRAAAKVERPAPVSTWWWLLPPVYYWKNHQRASRYKEEILDQLPDEHVQSLVRFRDKANAWLAVSLGSLLIATKETWELVHGLEWPEISFWLLVVFMGLLAVGNTLLRARGWREFDGRQKRPV